MILQALTKYYYILAKDSSVDIARAGYSTANISYALDISRDGELLNIVPLFEVVQRGKKTVEIPRAMVVPEAEKRSGISPAPNFLWDNAAFVLGISDKESSKGDYAGGRFNAFRTRLHRVLDGVDSDAARAVLKFIDTYDRTTARDNPLIARNLKGLLEGGNLVFRFEGKYVHDDVQIMKAWEASKASGDKAEMQCLVTGEITPIARLHAGLKGLGQSTGSTLVGFNKPAFESYGRTQGLNSPVGEAATFAYTTVLNYLLSRANPNKLFELGDAKIVYWAESENREYERVFPSFIEPPIVEVEETEGMARKKAEGALKQAASSVARVQALDLKALLEPLKGEDPHFYVLALSPNAGRASVRFFVEEPFSEAVDNIMAHYSDMKIVKEFENQHDYVTPGEILNETVSKKARDKNASPLLAGSLMRAILTNQPYPAALYYAILNRVRVDADDTKARIQKVNYIRAAVIKAYLTRKYRYQTSDELKGVLSVALNEQSTNTAYLMGRLFAVLESAQRRAIGKDINATIRDRYFATACGSPRSVFPTILRLSQHWIAKENQYSADQLIRSILSKLDVDRDPFPARLSLDSQGIFILGYYHQKEALFSWRTNVDKSSSEPQPTPDSELTEEAFSELA